ncbi:MAG: SGNH/GDSL hydrolase family protein [Pirellulales bacterium]|nr:SGNH/GDSL hydrolase family protein [Pirellulales bacterium]
MTLTLAPIPPDVSRAITLRQRVILLGASNLTRAFRTVYRLLTKKFGSNLEIMAALGAGRSYGLHSRVIARVLGPITESSIWETWAARTNLPTAALLTDIGNDLFYGAEVPQIAAWVEECLARLRPRCARIALTLVPADNVRLISAWRFGLLRRVSFPHCRLSLKEAGDRAAALNERLVALAARYQVETVPQPVDWYGFDPIHHQLFQYFPIWEKIFSAWDRPDLPPELPGQQVPARGAMTLSLEPRRASDNANAETLPLWNWWRRCWPQRQTIWGRECFTPQPSYDSRSGTTLELY